MRRCAFPLDPLVRVLVPCGLALAVASAEAGTAVLAASAYVVAPGYGGGWVGGPYYRPYYRPYYGAYYRPWVGPGWGWRYGYPGYGYPAYGYPGWGWGFGYGVGWGVATAPAWGWPAYYAAPSWVPEDVAVPAPWVSPSISDGVAAAPAPAPAPAAPQVAPQQPSYWYYCTEPAGYYPYVNQCSRPWIAVQPTSK